VDASNHDENRYELLAPAGDRDCLRSAVANGADAVYFGLEDFNARRRATNFTLAGLPELMAWLHGRNVKGYVAFNTLVMPDELLRAAEFVRGIIEAGADAIIVQDLGLIRLIRQWSPTFPIHASTQMTQTHPAGLAMLRDMGVSRVILARELSLADMKVLASAEIMELEVFVHGALCVSYSGQCLASESLWGRSGNRGICGQACRLPYELVVDGRPVPNNDGPYLLSPHDLATYDRIGDLIQAGVMAFKIEGRLKDANYVALTTSLYRQAIDAAIRGERFALSAEQSRALVMSFSRGFTAGFLDGNRHQELIGADSPKSRGLFIGTVVGRAPGGIRIRLAANGLAEVNNRDESVNLIKPGDGVVFAADDEEDAQGGRVYSVRLSAAESLIELTFGRDDIDLALIKPGTKVFKTDDPAIRRDLEATFARDRVVRPVPISAAIRASVGQPIELILRDDRCLEVCVRSDEPMQAAIRQPITLDVLRESLSRLGDTPFSLIEVTLFARDDDTAVDSLPVMVPKSVLNELRRRATAELIAQREEALRHALTTSDAAEVLTTALAATLASVLAEVQTGHTCENSLPSLPLSSLSVLARTIEQFEAAYVLAMNTDVDDAIRVETIYFESATKSEWMAAAEYHQKYREKYHQAQLVSEKSSHPHGAVLFGLATPQVLKLGDEHWLDAMLECAPDLLLVRNLATLRYVQQRRPEMRWVADASLNIANELSAATLATAGATRMTPGLDLNINQLAALTATALTTAVSQIPNIAFECIVHAHVPMFHMAHGIAAAHLSTGNDCCTCGQPCNRHVLHLCDRNSERHPVCVDVAGRTTIYNSRPQSMAANRQAWSWLTSGSTQHGAQHNVKHWRIELLDEDGSATRDLIEGYQRLLAGDHSAAAELRQKWPSMIAGTFEHK